MYNNKLKLSYRCDYGPKVSEPSIKGPLYWEAPAFVPTIYKTKALGNTKTPGTNILSRSTMEHCMKKYMYLWLNNSAEFWSMPIRISNDYIYLWIWNKTNWTYYKTPSQNITCFMCY